MVNVNQTVEGTVFSIASLDLPETNGQSLEPRGATTPQPAYTNSTAQASIHRRFQTVRVQILDALDDSTFGPIGKQRDRIALCALTPLFVLKSDGKVGVVPGFCRQRMCPTCQHRRGRSLTLRIAAAAAVMNAPRFITLTVRSCTDSLKHQLDRLYAWFRDLRRRDFWKAHVTGGVAVAEVTYNSQTGEWHPHLHIIVDGQFLPQAALANEWSDVNGGSPIVDIRAVYDRRNAAQYIAGYVAKPHAVAGWPPAAINEFAYALHGRRMLIAFGTSHRIKVPEDECETRPEIVEPLCSSPRLCRAALAGNPCAVAARELLARAGGLLAHACGTGTQQRGPRNPPLEAWEHEWLAECLREVGRDADSTDNGECPFADALTIAASPPQTRPATVRPRSPNCGPLLVDTSSDQAP